MFKRKIERDTQALWKSTHNLMGKDITIGIIVKAYGMEGRVNKLNFM